MEPHFFQKLPSTKMTNVKNANFVFGCFLPLFGAFFLDILKKSVLFKTWFWYSTMKVFNEIFLVVFDVSPPRKHVVLFIFKKTKITTPPLLIIINH